MFSTQVKNKRQQQQQQKKQAQSQAPKSTKPRAVRAEPEGRPRLALCQPNSRCTKRRIPKEIRLGEIR